MAKVIVNYNGSTATYTVATTLATGGKLMASDMIITPEQGSGEGNIEPGAKIVAPSSSTVTVTPGTGYDGMAQVNVKPVTNNLNSIRASVRSNTTMKIGNPDDDDAIASVTGTMADTDVEEVAGSKSGTTFTQGYVRVKDPGYITAGTKVSGAVFKNNGTSGVTYTDLSDTTAAPVLVENDYLYIDKGYTDNVKISLAKLVPEGATWPVGSSLSAGMVSGYSAYDSDGNLVTGSIVDRGATGINIPSSDADGNVPINPGYYSGGTVTTAKAVTSGGTINATTPPQYDSSKGQFKIPVSVSGAQVTSAGWISNSIGTLGVPATTTITLNPPEVTVTVSSASVQPVISKDAVTSGATDAAAGAATGTAPTTGVYVKVVTNNTTTLVNSGLTTTAGYVDGTNSHITKLTLGKGTVTMTASAAYVPITTANVGTPTATVSISAPAATTASASTVSVPNGATVVRWTATGNATYKQSAQGYVTDTATKNATAVNATLDIPVFQL